MKKKIYLFSICAVMLIVGIWGWVQATYAEDLTDLIVLDETETQPVLFIKAVNPGYKIDGISNVGEMIEIRRKDRSNTPISLAGTVVGYTNSSGKYSILFEFPENSWMVGENILLRLASSPFSELAAENYTKEIAMTGGLTLLQNKEVMDAVCFRGASKMMKVTDAEDAKEIGCTKAFNSTKPTILVFDETSGEFVHTESYEPQYEPGNYYVEAIEEEEGKGGGEATGGRCRGMEFSEILSYYESEKSEQFIEFFNTTDAQILLDGCKVSYKNKTYTLSGVVGSGGYFVYHPEGFALTKNPTNYNEISLLDVDGTVVDSMTYGNGQKKGTAYAKIGYDASGEELWRVTYAPTPGEANNYQEYKTCEEGKVINEATGNCVKVTEVKEKTCDIGYFLNALTGRCNKIATTTAKTCKEGYEINPDTGRCRKIQVNDGADYGLEPENYEESSVFVAVIAVVIVVLIGVGYLIYEFRREIVKLWRKVFRRVR